MPARRSPSEFDRSFVALSKYCRGAMFEPMLICWRVKCLACRGVWRKTSHQRRFFAPALCCNCRLHFFRVQPTAVLIFEVSAYRAQWVRRNLLQILLTVGAVSSKKGLSCSKEVKKSCFFLAVAFSREVKKSCFFGCGVFNGREEVIVFLVLLFSRKVKKSCFFWVVLGSRRVTKSCFFACDVLGGCKDFVAIWL